MMMEEAGAAAAEEDEEMEMDAELVFEVREVDPDYEFDAAMYFDFTREESAEEAREAERWFDSAPSYPPSPFVAKLLVMREDGGVAGGNEKIGCGVGSTSSSLCKGGSTLLQPPLLLNHASGHPLGPSISSLEEENEEEDEEEEEDIECEGTYTGNFTNLRSAILHKVSHQLSELAKGFTFNHHISTDNSKAYKKSSTKPKLPRSSTLMKPTASMLAKQNPCASRFQVLMGQKERSLCNSSLVESQASKRQKLEGGNLRKINDAKQQTDFIHKASKKDGTVDKSSAQARLRLTIPREPDLETANRALRMRPKAGTEPERLPVAVQRFKARPLNRKILEAPSLPLLKKTAPKLPVFQEFYLKTSERAMQHTSAFSSSSIHCNDSKKELDKQTVSILSESAKRELIIPSAMDASKQDGSSAVNVFRARPLNRKIFSSKGDIGVFRNNKRETTVPMEFNFHTDKRIQHNPPVDLFSKLSLASELQRNNGSHMQAPRPSCTSIKGSKENRLNPFQTEHKMTHTVKERPSFFGRRQFQMGTNACTSELGNELTMRSFGIR